ncbi:AraC family transcriptional regulator [Dyadobacter sp. LJ53]|uniref:helix-turn-helix domain-containing protein n=1 Tax=Dyadobacter chenwenxiniae TaxID=2906456 RepID=UPI001F4097F9|nr:AraC family transcriptional regulator [Dyadobacter chenwenxiniae]MCF0051506.1 AraC family transcriptional regulator [Dyadobacter chenwenxiniae]
MNNDLNYELIKPDRSLDDFVESFWMLQNQSDTDKEVIVLPDGRIDLIFTKSIIQAIQTTLLGIGTHPDKVILTKNTTMFAVSFKLLAAEYVFKSSISKLLNNAQNLPPNYWNFDASELNDFTLFYKKSSQIIQLLLPTEIDKRKEKLFRLIYSSNGELTVKELSEKVFWSSRQINRYFNQQFGLSLKAYCNILRFRASFQHIKDGSVFPQQNFADQSHFIKEVKKLSGALPKELKNNQNDRFIQFYTLPNK